MERSYNHLSVCAFGLATGVSLPANVERWPAGAELGVMAIEEWWNLPGNASREVTIGEAARWFSLRQYNRMRTICGIANIPD